jgi:SIR2-like domain
MHKSVKSEQHNCSPDSNHGPPTVRVASAGPVAYFSVLAALALLGDPVDQTRGIQQRRCLIEELLDVESDFKTLLVKARSGARIGWLDTEVPDQRLSVAPGAEETTMTAPKPRRRIIDVNEFTPANLNQPGCVFHLHGSVIEPKGMIMTTRDYIGRYANDRRGDDPALENRTLTFLEFLFQQKTVLFVGYGLDDLEILEYVVQKARQQVSSEQPQARHFMLQGYFAHEYELMRSMKLYYSQCDIELIAFRRDQRDWQQLIEVLEAFAAAMPANTPLGLQKQVDMEALLD